MGSAAPAMANAARNTGGTGKRVSGLPVCAMRFTATKLPAAHLPGVKIAGVKRDDVDPS
jgi:hypothetical protein